MKWWYWLKIGGNKTNLKKHPMFSVLTNIDVVIPAWNHSQRYKIIFYLDGYWLEYYMVLNKYLFISMDILYGAL